ncbi:MAG: PD-(D/E)XK nuclease domain-containing protein [Clostridium sp.]
MISNREQGQGRYDICLESKKQENPSFLFELKYARDKAVDLKRLAQLGYQQIISKQYDQGLQPVIRIYLAHRGKQVEVYTKQKLGNLIGFLK